MEQQDIINAVIFLGSVLTICVISAIFRICYLLSEQLRIQKLEFDINYKKKDEPIK